jgi:hypothetical protein
VAVIEQEINERRCPAADVDDACILAYGRRGDERQRQVGAGLMPTDILRPFGLIHLIPIFLTIHLMTSIPLRAGRLTASNGSWNLFRFGTFFGSQEINGSWRLFLAQTP